MSRLRADCLLLTAAMIWGAAFVAQKTGMDNLGPFGFAGLRFSLSFLAVLPLAILESRRSRIAMEMNRGWTVALCLSFFAAVVLQQAGIMTTSVTHAGFLTGLYVLGVPLILWALFRQKPSLMIAPACLAAFAGIWLLNGAFLFPLQHGDALVLASAAGFAAQIALMGFLIQKTDRPLTLSVLQYGFCAVAGLTGAFLLEDIGIDSVMNNLPQLLYTGIVSGGIAYTLQALAQRHTPPSDTAIIISSESVFAALAGALFLDERLEETGWAGCALILSAVLLIEIRSLYGLKRREGTGKNKAVREDSRSSERGNVLWFILVAIVLLGALTILLSRSGSTVDQSGDVERARIRSGELMRYAAGIQTAIQQMTGRGISESDLSFENSKTGADYTNPNCTMNDCRVFDAGGGGASYRDPPTGANDGSDWIFTGANNVGTDAAPVGTTAARSGNDLVMLLPHANAELCKQANRDLGVGTNGEIPEDSSGIDTAVFAGEYANGLTVIDGDPAPFELNRKIAGCFTDTGPDPDVTYFYYVLLAR